MRKIVITGGAGFISSHVVERFAQEFEGAEIIVIDNMTYASDIRNIAAVHAAGAADLVLGDVCDYALCHNLMKGADLVIQTVTASGRRE